MKFIHVERFDGKKPDVLDYAAGALLGGVLAITLGPPLLIISLIAPRPNKK